MLEQEVNTHYISMVLEKTKSEKWRHHLLSLQIRRLMVCLDVLLESWNSSYSSDSAKIDFPRERLFLQAVRWYSFCEFLQKMVLKRFLLFLFSGGEQEHRLWSFRKCWRCSPNKNFTMELQSMINFWGYLCIFFLLSTHDFRKENRIVRILNLSKYKQNVSEEPQLTKHKREMFLRKTISATWDIIW